MSQIVVGSSVLIVALMIVAYYCLATVSFMDNEVANETENVAAAATTPMEFVFDRNGVADCNRTHLPCVSDTQCRNNCAISGAGGGGEFTCNENGFCAIRDSNVTGRPDDFECDAALGLLNVFAASEFVVTQTCVSTYRDLVDDLGEPRPYLCGGGGRLSIDVVDRQFSADDCQCAQGYTKMLFDQTALARSIPVCIPTSSANLYAKVYAVLN
uniref:Per os infectivity factor 3 n=1 Tax=Lymantria dispar multicapsid nuclear polyhedrosis virus TaxID=10449 RepID=A0A1B1MR19_NPVLD|nr:per os infectivity factor 3 [Lymantria dispar multiple nucleopolyhedrovirus]